MNDQRPVVIRQTRIRVEPFHFRLTPTRRAFVVSPYIPNRCDFYHDSWP